MKRGVLAALAATGALAGIGWAVAHGSEPAPPAPEEPASGVQSTQNPDEIASYWTDERMRDAQPPDMTRPGR